jgi:hypothetical protein
MLLNTVLSESAYQSFRLISYLSELMPAYSLCHHDLPLLELSEKADEKQYPIELIKHFSGVAASLLAVAVGVYAFVPLIVELALNRSDDPHRAFWRARRAERAFDSLLLAVAALGLSLCCGILAIYVRIVWIYWIEVGSLVLGLVTLLIGVLVLGWALRTVRTGR